MYMYKFKILFLINIGANPSLEDSMGRAPINYCTNESVRKLLEKYSVKVSEEVSQNNCHQTCILLLVNY